MSSTGGRAGTATRSVPVWLLLLLFPAGVAMVGGLVDVAAAASAAVATVVNILH